MFTSVLILTAAIVALYFFARGRAVCPLYDRLPLAELDNLGILYTIMRGWTSPNIRRY